MPRYRVQCVIRETGKETALVVTASSPERALARVHSLGHITGRIVEIPDPHLSQKTDEGEEIDTRRSVQALVVVGGAAVVVAFGILTMTFPIASQAPSRVDSAGATIADAREKVEASGPRGVPGAVTPVDANATPNLSDSIASAAPVAEMHKDPEPASTVRTLDGHFVRVQIRGTIGEDCVVDGVARSLRAATNVGVPAIVFDIDSPGGSADIGRQMSHLINEYRGKLLRVAVVHRAHSAAAWVAVACDVIVMEEGSAIGAAVAYTPNHTTGSVEVDAKFNAGLASEMAGIASANGHNPDVVMAMGVMDKELYWWRPSAGEKRVLTATRPNPGALDVQVLDTATSILGLDAAKADEIGFAFRRGNLALAFGPSWLEESKHLGTDHMQEAVQGIVAARERTQAEKRQEAQHAVEEKQRLETEARDEAERVAAYNRKVEEVAGMIRKLRSYIDDAKRKDPASFGDYYYSTATGLLTPDSQQAWTARTDSAVTAWSSVRLGWKDIALKMKQLGLDEDGSRLKAEVEAQYTEAEMHISSLQARRVRYR